MTYKEDMKFQKHLSLFLGKYGFVVDLGIWI